MKYKKLFLLTSTIFAANISMANATDFTNITLSENHKPSHLVSNDTDVRDIDPLARDTNISSVNKEENVNFNQYLLN